MGRFAPGPEQPRMTMGAPLEAPGPVNVSSAGVHPLVKASMLPRMKTAKAQGSLKARRGQMAGMSRTELKSKRSEVGRQPRG